MKLQTSEDKRDSWHLRALWAAALASGAVVAFGIIFQSWELVVPAGALAFGGIWAALYFRAKSLKNFQKNSEANSIHTPIGGLEKNGEVLSDAADISQAFRETLVKEVMVPRTDMLTVQDTFTVADSLDLMLFNGFSRMPVCTESVDSVQGIAYAKDLMAIERDNGGNKLVTEIMRESNFVPETKRISDLLREMQTNRFHVAIAVDEYGGVAGLVTLEDLIEEIVGEITDEFDIEEPLIERLNGFAFMVNGRVSMNELSETLGHEFLSGEWSTVGGFIFTTLGHIPEEKEELEVDGFLFRVVRVQGRRIARIKVQKNDA